MANQYAGRWSQAIFSSNSKLLKNREIELYADEACTELATTYSDREKTAVVFGLFTDELGNAEIFADPGTYWLQYSDSLPAIQIEIREDVDDTADVEALTQAIATHNADTTSVHGITDTTVLETQSGAQAKADEAQSNAITAASGFVDAHNSDTTSVHGIADTSQLETQSGAQAKADAAEAAAIAAGAPRIEPVNNVTAAGSAQTLPDVYDYSQHRLQLSAPTCSLTFPEAEEGKSFTVITVQPDGGVGAVSWPENVRWPSGVEPVLSNGPGKVDYFAFDCTDGENYDGFTVGLDLQWPS